ncbi:M81 family metallopeptidase [Curtobacterium ammoniigenes]|uniref:M81 family metallopeptidase n=1 Tax=Curtobacterium ammoniigenes TaxID=395387 RepID=UPI000836A061|nr:M81 family metallopeptidase [Curtobacterium ammoniigenes]
MSDTTRRRPLIAIAGLGIEASTFSPARTEAPAFHPMRGSEIFDRYAAFLGEGTELRRAADWHPALVGKALPGGTATAAAFATLSDEIVERLRAMPPLDGLWYDIHGAMTVEGLADAEAVLLRRIREAVGPDVLISTTMDLHGNVSRELAHQSDLITCYRMAPHEDAEETKERGVRNLVERLQNGAGRPLKAWVPIPVLLPGEKTSTRIEPAKSVYAQVSDAAAQPGVLDAAIWVGYAWADEPRNRAVAVVTGDDEAAVGAQAERLARAFWEAGPAFDFVAPVGSLAETLDAAIESDKRPYFISDSGDNPTAGGAGDVTWTLARLLEDPRVLDTQRVAIYASIPGPDAVATAVEAGVGATVTVTAGAAVDDVHEGPVTFTGVVDGIRHGDRDAEIEVVIRVGGVRIIVTKLRKPYHLERDFTGLGLDPRNADIVVVKIGYLEPELYDMAAGWMMALTPGGVDQDLVRLGHDRIRRPMLPFDAPDFDPDLHARFIAPSNEPLTGPDE